MGSVVQGGAERPLKPPPRNGCSLRANTRRKGTSDHHSSGAHDLDLLLEDDLEEQTDDPFELDEARLEPADATTVDSLQLTEVGRHRLLTAAEEVKLAKQVERGDLEAKERMVNANLRLVVSIASATAGTAFRSWT